MMNPLPFNKKEKSLIHHCFLTQYDVIKCDLYHLTNLVSIWNVTGNLGKHDIFIQIEKFVVCVCVCIHIYLFICYHIYVCAHVCVHAYMLERERERKRERERDNIWVSLEYILSNGIWVLEIGFLAKH